VRENGTTDVAANALEPANGTNFQSFAGFVVRTLSGIHSYTIDFAQVATGTATIRRARLAIWRVA
jgi:hypothetical protein